MVSKQWFVKMKPWLSRPSNVLMMGAPNLFRLDSPKYIPTGWRISGTGAFPASSGGDTDTRMYWIAVKSYAQKKTRQACPNSAARSHLIQDPDVLDTWFQFSLVAFFNHGLADKTEDLSRSIPRRYWSPGEI
jgi:valyl-tRNA synthetase